MTFHPQVVQGTPRRYALPLSDRWAAAWLHAGRCLLISAAFLLEYGYRRWRLCHLGHPGLHRPRLLRGNGTASP